MKRKIIFHYVIIFLIVPCYTTLAGFTVHTGGNITALQPKFSSSQSGQVFGVHKYWGSQKTMIATGLSYSMRRCILKNRNFVFYNSRSGYYLDIHVAIDYLEIPVLFKQYRQITKNIKAGLCVGPSLAIAICDNTESKRLRYFNFEQSDDTKPAHIDYWENDDGGPVWADCSVFYMNFGFLLVFSDFYLEARYNYAMNDVNTVAGKIIMEKFHTVNLLIGVEIF